MQPVDLVAYSLEEPPYFWTSHMGSAVHAADVKRRGLPVAFMAPSRWWGTSAMPREVRSLRDPLPDPRPFPRQFHRGGGQAQGWA